MERDTSDRNGQRQPRPLPQLPPPPWLAPRAPVPRAQSSQSPASTHGWGLPRGTPPPPRLPPHPRALVGPRPPWPPGAPPPFALVRPPMQAPRFHRPPAPFQRSARPLAPVDPDASWLSAFKKTHLEDAKETKDARTRNPSEPPLRRVQRHIGEVSATLIELESNARQLIQLEQTLSQAEAVQEDEELVNRLRAESEERRSFCEELRTKLDELCYPAPLGLGPETARDVIAFSKRIEKKKIYRIRRKEKLRAERVIQSALASAVANKESQTSSADATASVSTNGEPTQVESLPETTAVSPGSTLRRTRNDERAAAQKVLLLLRLKELRRGNSVTREERDRAQAIHDQAMACLRSKRKRKRRRKREALLSPSTESASIAHTRIEATRRVTPLRDPYAIDMESLIDVRRRWDFFLAPPNVNGATSIPPHFVIPPTNPSSEWVSFLEQS